MFFLDMVKHTSNTLTHLKHFAETGYSGAANYIDQPAVRDGNIVTANGTAYLEFCREILYALKLIPLKLLKKVIPSLKKMDWDIIDFF